MLQSDKVTQMIIDFCKFISNEIQAKNKKRIIYFTIIDEIKLKTLLLKHVNLSYFLYVMISDMKNSILHNDNYDLSIYCLFNYLINEENQEEFDGFCENKCLYSKYHGCCDEIDSTYDKLTNCGNILLKDLIGRERIVGYIEKKFIL